MTARSPQMRDIRAVTRAPKRAGTNAVWGHRGRCHRQPEGSPS